MIGAVLHVILNRDDQRVGGVAAVRDGFDQQTAISDYTRLISQDKVDLLLGTFSSDLNVAVAPIAERYKMAYVQPSGGADEIFEREKAALKDRDRLMDEKFKEAVKRAEEEPDTGRPVRPFDLD